MIIIFDTETTGLTLHPAAEVGKQPRIIEFGCVLMNDQGEVELEYETLIHPQCSISPEITKITGLTDADMVGAVPFVEVLDQLRSLFSKATSVVAHNLPFDKAMLMNELIRNDIVDFPWPQKEFCTVGMHKDEWGRNPKLVELYADKMGEPLAQTHRALDDVHAMVKIIQKEKLWRIM